MKLIGRHFGHIRVTQVVGQGGMGDVYGGYDEKLERKVALKVLNDDQRLDAEARERLLREARALSKLDHPNICRIHDYIETPDVDAPNPDVDVDVPNPDVDVDVNPPATDAPEAPAATDAPSAQPAPSE